MSTSSIDRPIPGTPPQPSQPVAAWSEVGAPASIPKPEQGSSNCEERRNPDRGRFAANGDFRTEQEAERDDVSGPEEKAPVPEDYLPT